MMPQVPSLDQRVADLESQLAAQKVATEASIRGLSERVGMIESGQRYKLVLREEKP